jgi:hypothetical protein
MMTPGIGRPPRGEIGPFQSQSINGTASAASTAAGIHDPAEKRMPLAGRRVSLMLGCDDCTDVPLFGGFFGRDAPMFHESGPGGK